MHSLKDPPLFFYHLNPTFFLHLYVRIKYLTIVVPVSGMHDE
jgi:hypothetical protein